jgi:YbgC/YbaW family acyl-CoA thioester hydrolase
MHEIRLQTYWVDADPAGIVYFSNFFRMVEQAEEEIFLKAGAPRQRLLDEHQIWFPRVEAHIKYDRPIYNGRAIRVRIEPELKGEKTIRLEFSILDDVSLERVAEGYIVIVCVDRAQFKATRIPQLIRDVMVDGPRSAEGQEE